VCNYKADSMLSFCGASSSSLIHDARNVCEEMSPIVLSHLSSILLSAVLVQVIVVLVIYVVYIQCGLDCLCFFYSNLACSGVVHRVWLCQLAFCPVYRLFGIGQNDADEMVHG